MTSELGAALHARMAELYPVCRSITGPGVRRTLELVGERLAEPAEADHEDGHAVGRTVSQ